MIDVSPEITARFWAKVQKTDTCWLWTASKRNKGYGAFAYVQDGRTVHDRAHRFSYRLHIGGIPPGMFVLHRCDTPACVNPNHLFLGTNQDNVTDMMRKGRNVVGGTYCGDDNDYRRGADHHAVKLTVNDVREMRQLHAAGGWSYAALGRRFAVNISAAWKIVNRKLWRHVD